MRKQYHFHPSERGLLAWDVNRLVELSIKFPITDIPITDIRELDETFWFNEKEDKPTCKNIAEHAKLMSEVDMSFPIILFSDGRVVDGMHRVCRAWIEGAKIIKAVQFTTDPKPDYVGVASNDLPY